MTDGSSRSLLALWAKSNAGGVPHSLLGHLLDTGAVGELIWDEFLSRTTREQLDRYCGGRGRSVFVALCAWHDLGKATPAFQSQARELVPRVKEVGLTLPRGSPPLRPRMRHEHSSHVIALDLLSEFNVVGGEWMPVILAGHHGMFLTQQTKKLKRHPWHCGPSSSTTRWHQAQQDIGHRVLDLLDLDMTDLLSTSPPLALQMAVAGFVSMADWIASSTLFPGLDRDDVSAKVARARAGYAWHMLGLAATPVAYEVMTSGRFESRFDRAPRPLQDLVIDVCRELPGPGLIIVEAPTGEGKTEAAFAATETLAARFGANGYVFAMPTQGTTDAMYDRCRRWTHDVDSRSTVSLLHGKAMANEAWRELLHGTPVDVEGVGEPDEYGVVSEEVAFPTAPSTWLLGRHRGLLASSLVTTVDQPLIAATHIKYVALRHAGLTGKVLIIDEVHSYDVYMSQFLHQLLRWCSDASIPVILMSATLPPAQRQELMEAYGGGLNSRLEVDPTSAVSTDYPVVTTWSPPAGASARSCAQARADLSIRLEPLPSDDVEDTGPIAHTVADLTRDGGCALVVLNTVRRAQETYSTLKRLDVPTVLLHGRLTTGERADRTAALISQLGPSGADRPERLVIVATQIAEQSFDIDADVLVTDICPTDLLIQRIGRLHRHDRSPSERGRHARPQVWVSGICFRSDRAPATTMAFDHVYDRHSILRTAALLSPDGTEWHLPSATPSLVAAAYADNLQWPSGWESDGEAARVQADAKKRARQDNATLRVLRPLNRSIALAGLHDPTGAAPNERGVSVRDGEPNVEVALVRHDARTGFYTTLGGTPLGSNGERATQEPIALRVLRDTVRLRDGEELTHDLRPLPGWADVPLLRFLPALILDPNGRRTGPWGSVTYDRETGLAIERSRRR